MQNVEKSKIQRNSLPKAGGGLYLKKEALLVPFIAMAIMVYFCILAAPIISIVKTAGMGNVLLSLNNPDNISVIRLTLYSTFITTFFIFVLCTPVAFHLCSKEKNIYKTIIEVLVNIPTVLPPAVSGTGLLLAFGRFGFLGEVFAKLNIQITFTMFAVVLAQFFVASGFYIQVLKVAIDEISPEIYEASYDLGANKFQTITMVILPMLKKPIFAGLMVSWTRAIGEFGATIMFAGNVLGKTRTVPLQIYTLMQSDIISAAALSFILLIISFTMLFVVKMCLKR